MARSFTDSGSTNSNIRLWLLFGGTILLIIVGLLKGDFSATWVNGSRL